MSTEHKEKTKPVWDRTAYDALRATWTPERIAEDQKVLDQVFKLAENAPMLAEALDWAKAHDVVFFVDRQANSGGYYNISTGVMAVVLTKDISPARMVEVITHELRHAWQDYNGLITWDNDVSRKGKFKDFFINNALIEADAMAHGKMAREQFEAAAYGRALPPSNAQMTSLFMSWFNDFRPSYYGDHFSKVYGRKWGVYKGAVPSHNEEFVLDRPPQQAGMDLQDMHDVLRLGSVGFSGTGQNYLAALPRDILPKYVLRPSLANNFWRHADRKQRKLTTELRKAELRHQLGQPKARHPWP